MTDLLKDLEAVAGLDERATPGIIELHTSCSWRRIMAPRGRGFLVPGIDPDKHPNMDSIENAQFVVALVNWFRTHHAEIAEALKVKSCAWDEDGWDGSWDTACGCKHQFINGSPRDNDHEFCPYCGGKLKVVDAAIAAWNRRTPEQPE